MLNHVYRVIYNQATGCYVAVSEIAKSAGKTKSIKTGTTPSMSTLAVSTTRQGLQRSVLALAIASVTGLGVMPSSYAVTCGQGSDGNNNSNTACGTDSTASGDSSTATGASSMASGYASTATGSASTASGDSSTATGANSEASDLFSTASGDSSTASGYNSTATGANSEASGYNSTATGVNSDASDTESTATGANSEASGTESTATGTSSTASRKNSTATGASSTASSDNSTATGYYSTASGDSSTASGYKSTASGDSSTASGAYTGAIGVSSVALGGGDQITASGTTQNPSFNFNVPIKTDGLGRRYRVNNSGIAHYEYTDYTYATSNSTAALSTADNAIAIGVGTHASIADGVALGSQSRSTVGAGVAGYRASGNTTPTWQATHAAVSVGDTSGLAADWKTRQITGVAAGAAPTDAVNVAQLTGVNDKVNNNASNIGKISSSVTSVSNKPLTFTGDNTGTSVARKLGETLGIKGGATTNLTNNNIGVTTNPTTNTLNVQLAKDINLGNTGSVTTGNTVLNTTGITIANGANPVTLTASGLNNGGNKITGVAKGTAPKDAVNFEQLTKIGQYVGQADVVMYDTVNRDNITLGYNNATNPTSTGITNLKAGALNATSTDAVNGSQLFATNKSVMANTNRISMNTTNIGSNSNSNAVDANGNAIKDDKGQRLSTNRALTTYSVGDHGESHNNSVVSAIYRMNQEGIKYFHTNDKTANANATNSNPENGDAAANASYSTAIGYDARTGADADNALAIGKGAQALGINSISIGTGNVVIGKNSGAIGDPSIIDANSSYSVGNNNTLGINANDTFVLGNNVSTDVANSVVLGNQSTITSGRINSKADGSQGNTSTAGATGVIQDGVAGAAANGAVSVGASGSERRIQNVAAGEVSVTSTDTINGSQLYRSQAQTLGYTDNRIRSVEDRNDKAVAASLAFAALNHPHVPGKVSVGLGGGSWTGETGYAVGVSYTSTDGRTSISGAFGGNDQENGGNVGISFVFD